MPEKYDIGFLGGGQLARMSIQAAQRMGLTCISLDPSSDSPASQIASAITGKLDDTEAVAQILSRANKVTLENEFIPATVINDAYQLVNTRNLESDPVPPRLTQDGLTPSTQALATIQDKLTQRRALQKAGVPGPKSVDLGMAFRPGAEMNFPMVLKARFGGYDGKGTRYARTHEELMSHESLWSQGGWLAEEFVPFKRELAVMVARTHSAAYAYPTMETIQTNHVCDLVFPSGADGSGVAIAAIEAIGGYGLFGVELFELEDGQILVNEIAPRPHNTGHYTLDWDGPSQFETHIRCVMEYPLLPIASGSNVVMANLLGLEWAGDFRDAIPAALRHKGARFHWYGKNETKTGRKMGHLNVVGDPGEPISAIVDRAKEARDDFYTAWQGK